MTKVEHCKSCVQSKIRACFDYRGSNYSHLEVDELTGIVLVLPNVPWDIEWAQLIPMGKNFNLRLKWKGKETPFGWEDLSISKVIKTLKFYRG